MSLPFIRARPMSWGRVTWSNDGYFSFLMWFDFPHHPQHFWGAPDPIGEGLSMGQGGTINSKDHILALSRLKASRRWDRPEAKEQCKTNKRNKGSPADDAKEVQRKGLGLCYPGRLPGGGSGETALKDEEDMDKKRAEKGLLGGYSAMSGMKGLEGVKGLDPGQCYSSLEIVKVMAILQSGLMVSLRELRTALR